MSILRFVVDRPRETPWTAVLERWMSGTEIDLQTFSSFAPQ